MGLLFWLSPSSEVLWSFWEGVPPCVTQQLEEPMPAAGARCKNMSNVVSKYKTFSKHKVFFVNADKTASEAELSPVFTKKNGPSFLTGMEVLSHICDHI